jgi:ABC-2 type transport system ATP-binding protein
MIYTENLTKYFDDFLAVDSVNLDVRQGQVLVLLGPNGAGKTTTVRMLTSILKPSSGTARMAGFDIIREADRVRASVGVLTEHHGLYSRMDPVEYLEFYSDLFGLEKTTARRQIDELLEQFGLAHARKQRLGEYSKGMRQKLALVRALIHNPPVLLLDEPTSAMDPESARMVRDSIRNLRSAQRTILMCTHNLNEAEDLADQIAIIRRGKIILNDSPANLKRLLLGPDEYEAQLAGSLNGKVEDWPQGVVLTGQGENWLRFQVDDPQASNPLLLRRLLDLRLPVVSFHLVPRSLEDAYLQAVLQDEPSREVQIA